MNLNCRLLLGALATAVALTAGTSDAPGPDQIRPAANKAIAALQRTAAGFAKNQGCFSCHHSGLPLMAMRAAREHGLTVNEAAVRQSMAKPFWYFLDRQSVDNAVQATFLIDPAMSEGSQLLAAHESGLAPNLATAIYARRIASWQRPDGHWNTIDSRPPQSYSVFTATAVALRAVQLYMPPRLKGEADAVATRARRWLLASEPHSTEEFTFRLFGLQWSGAGLAETRAAAEKLLALQQPDGGWSQMPSRASDAYSTGQALVALRRAGGVAVSHPAWQRGIRYLLSTQKPDGMWVVPTRQISPAQVSPPYFETGIPYGHDQFLAASATSWAITALAEALPASMGTKPLPLQPFAAPVEPWMETALFGTAGELKGLLDRGLDPNSKDSGGVTLLMMAAADPEKVRLLLESGADARAKSKTGFTPLMAAATWQGVAASARQLLAKGAEVNPGPDVLFNASPLFLAAFSGDREMAELLHSRGADVKRRMNLLGLFPASPLFIAVNLGDAGMVADLLAYGADLEEQDEFKMTALAWAVVEYRPTVVRALLEAGADVNHSDKYGYTPLLYAATLDFGDSTVMKALLKAGANPKARSTGGHTPLSQTKRYHYAALQEILEAAGAKE